MSSYIISLHVYCRTQHFVVNLVNDGYKQPAESQRNRIISSKQVLDSIWNHSSAHNSQSLLVLELKVKV
jgi:hypothetical protein